MLSISNPLKGADAGKYYLELARDDYYLGAGEAPGRWYGQGASLLRLPAEVKGRHFLNLLAGCSPDGKLALVQNARKPERQSGWDLTFSAPKSVSVLWAMAPPELRQQIEAIHKHAVQTALSHLEATCALTRRGQGGQTVESAAVLFATFQHRTSRAQDPQLHTHAVLVNLGLREDGTTGSVLSRPFFEQKLALGALYRTDLAAGLRQGLGLTLEPDRVGFHVAGVPRELCREHSQRRQQIERKLEERGAVGAVAAKVAALDTRPAKITTGREDLFARWQEYGQSRGFGAAQALALTRGAAHPPVDRVRFEREVAAGLAAVPEAQRTPRQVLSVAVPAAVRHGVDARTLLRSVSGLVERDWRRLPRLVHVEWRRLFDHTPWLKSRGKFLYTETHRPFARGWWRPAREFQLPRVRVELPRVALGARKRPYQRQWWKIYWKRDLGVGELRVQERVLFPQAPKWSPLHGRSLPALRFTTQKSQEQDRQAQKDRDQGHSH